jgi:hypothetical protein
MNIHPRTNIAIGLSAAVLVVAAPFALWIARYRAFCESRFAAANFGAHQAAGCFEFWLNRYQTLIAAFVGLLVAVGTGVLVYRQWIEARAAAAFNRRAILREALTDSADFTTKLYAVEHDARGAAQGLEKLLSSPIGVDQSIVAAVNNHLIDVKANWKRFAVLPNNRPRIYPTQKIMAYAIALRVFRELADPLLEPPTDFFLEREQEQTEMRVKLRHAFGGVEAAFGDLLQAIFDEESQVNREIAAAEADMSQRLRRPPIEN